MSRIEIGREMGNRTGARPKEGNTSSSFKGKAASYLFRDTI